MTRHIFGVDDTRLQDPPRPDDLDPVADALAGHYDDAELAEIVASADSASEPDRPAARLLAQLEAAHRDSMRPATPPTSAVQGTPAPFSVYASPAPDAAPLEVVLGDGERTTVVPAGRSDWQLAEPVTPGGLFIGEPAPPARSCGQVHPQHDVHHPDGH